MANKLKHKKSFGDKLRETCSNMVHSLKLVSNAVLLSSEHDKSVDDLFDSSDEEHYYPQITLSKNAKMPNDFESAIRQEKSNLEFENIRQQKSQLLQLPLDTTIESTPIGSFKSMSNQGSTTTTNASVNGFQLWDQQRQEWLKQTQTNEQIVARREINSLNKLTSHHDDVYLNIYRNLVQQGKPLKKGINMTDGFKVIHDGWEHTKMFERVMNGGVP